MGSSNIMVSIPGTPSQLTRICSSSQMNFRPVLRIGPAQDTLQNQQQPQVDNPQSGEARSGARSGGRAALSRVNRRRCRGGPAQSGVHPTVLDEATARGVADADGDGVLSDTPRRLENASDLAWATGRQVTKF